MSYLIDTNVLSELRRKQPDPNVVAWMQARPRQSLFLSVLTLGEIRTLLRFKDAPEENCEEVNALLDEHIGHVAARIKELRNLQLELKELRAQCGAARDAAACGILNGLDKAASERRDDEPKPKTHGDHVHGTHALSATHGPRSR